MGLGLGALEIGVRYVSEREQFGVPIGSFQAIQHTLADVSVALDGAQLLARKAAWAARHPRPGTARAGARRDGVPVRRRTRAARVRRVLHFHGGYGFMEEYDIQLYYRRAKGWAIVLDEPEHDVRAPRRPAVRPSRRPHTGRS